MQSQPYHAVPQDQLYQWFNNVDVDRSGAISANELQAALSLGSFTFDADLCRKMIGMFDQDMSGTININEFCQLHNYLTAMKGAFYQIDVDKNGTLSYQEVDQALRSGGYNLSPVLFQKIFMVLDKNRRGFLTFDGYIKLCIFLGTGRHQFNRFVQPNGTATFTFDTFNEALLPFLM